MVKDLKAYNAKREAAGQPLPVNFATMAGVNLEGDAARRGSSALRLADDAARQAPRPRGEDEEDRIIYV